MSVLIVAALLVVAYAGTMTVLAPTPDKQAVTLAVFGATLVTLFVILQAPDVALSELGIGTAITPLMVMLAIRTMRKDQAEAETRQDDQDDR